MTVDAARAIATRPFDQATVRAEAAADGRCAPLTNRQPRQLVDTGNQGETATIPTPGTIQNDLLKLLDVDPTQPRWP